MIQSLNEGRGLGAKCEFRRVVRSEPWRAHIGWRCSYVTEGSGGVSLYLLRYPAHRVPTCPPPTQKRCGAVCSNLSSALSQSPGNNSSLISHQSLAGTPAPSWANNAKSTTTLRRPSHNLCLQRHLSRTIRLPLTPDRTMRHPHCTPQHSSGNLGQLWTHWILSRAGTQTLSILHCLDSDSNSYRVCDNIILYPAPLVLSGASWFDQLLALTERLTLAAETHTPHDQAQLSLCVGSLNNFLTADTNTQNTPTVRLQLLSSLEPPAAIPSATPTISVIQSTRHRLSSDDLIGWTFHEHSLGYCKVLHTDTYLDSDSISLA